MSVYGFAGQIVESVFGVNLSGNIVVFSYDSAHHFRNCEQWGLRIGHGYEATG